MNNIVVEFEDSLLAHIRATLPVLKTVEPYAGELEEAKKDILQKQTPACYSVVARRAFDDACAVESDSSVEAVLLVAVRNLRSKGEALRGGVAGEVGLYDLLEAIRAAIVGRRFPDPAAVPLGVSEWDATLVSSDVCLGQLNLVAGF